MSKYDPTALFREQRILCLINSDLIYHLRPDEHVIFATYFDNHDISPLTAIIRENKSIADDFREFIADAMSGHFKRRKGRKNTTTVRNFEIYAQIRTLLLDDPTLRLRVSEAQCYATIRQLRWADGVACPHCDSGDTIRRGYDSPQRVCQR